MNKKTYLKKRIRKNLTIEEKAFDEFFETVPASYSFEVRRDGPYLEFRTVGEHAAQVLTEILPAKYEGLDVIIVYEEILQ